MNLGLNWSTQFVSVQVGRIRSGSIGQVPYSITLYKWKNFFYTKRSRLSSRPLSNENIERKEGRKLEQVSSHCLKLSWLIKIEEHKKLTKICHCQIETDAWRGYKTEQIWGKKLFGNRPGWPSGLRSQTCNSWMADFRPRFKSHSGRLFCKNY